MIEAALLSRLEEVLQLESHSFVRYVAEVSGTRPRDAFDARLLAFYQEWYRVTERNVEALRACLEEEGYFPQSGPWPLSFLQYNYVTPSYLLDAVIQKMAAHLDAVSARVQALAGWPRARGLVEAAVEREVPLLARARALHAERATAPSPPPRVKGTSAARW
jgi:hypothetical protein